MKPAKPGSIAALTQGWRDHLLATHHRQIRLAEARKVQADGVLITLRRESTHRCLSYNRGALEARVWRHPDGSGYVTLLKDWGRWQSQQMVLR